MIPAPFQASRAAVRRFPLTFILLLSGCLGYNLRLIPGLDQLYGWPPLISFICLSSALWSLGAGRLAEYNGWSKLTAAALDLAGLALPLIFLFSNDFFPVKNVFPFFQPYFMFMAGLFLLAHLLPYLLGEKKGFDDWLTDKNYNSRIRSSLLGLVLIAAGLMLLILAVEDFSMFYRLIMNLLSLKYFFNSISLAPTEPDIDYFFLGAYHGLVCEIPTCGFLGLACYLSAWRDYEIRGDFMPKTWLALPLLTALPLAASLARLVKSWSRYGFTETSYLILLACLVLLLWITASLFKNDLAPKLTITLLAVLLLASSFGPFSSFNVVNRSQTAILKELLCRNQLLTYRQITIPYPPPELSPADLKTLTRLGRHFQERRNNSYLLQKISLPIGVEYRDFSKPLTVLGLEDLDPQTKEKSQPKKIQR